MSGNDMAKTTFKQVSVMGGHKMSASSSLWQALLWSLAHSATFSVQSCGVAGSDGPAGSLG
jgi:hypothetical protein